MKSYFTINDIRMNCFGYLPSVPKANLSVLIPVVLLLQIELAQSVFHLHAQYNGI